MQRLLLEAGLPPTTLLSDPEKIGSMHPSAIVRDIKNGQFVCAWQNRPPMQTAEQFMAARLDRYLQSGLQIGEAMERLTKEVNDNTGLFGNDTIDLMDALDALSRRETTAIEFLPKVEIQLQGVVENVPALRERLQPDEYWRLFATAGELDSEGSNPIRVERRFHPTQRRRNADRPKNAFSVMLNGYLEKEPLTGEHVMKINQAGPRPGFRQGPTVVTTTSTGFDPDFKSLDRLTQDDDWFKDMTISGNRSRGMGDSDVHEYNFSLPKTPSPELCKQRLDLIMDSYRHGIETIDGRREDIRKEIIEKILKRGVTKSAMTKLTISFRTRSIGKSAWSSPTPFSISIAPNCSRKGSGSGQFPW